MRVMVGRGRVGASSAIKRVSRIATLVGWVGAATLPACELVVGTDDFKTSPDFDSGSASTGQTDASGSASTGSPTDASSSTVDDSGPFDDASHLHDSGSDATKPEMEAGGGMTFADAAGLEAGVDAAAALCTVSLGDSYCSTCWKQSCCSEYAACQENAQCVAIAQCVLDCVSTPCDCTGPTAAMQLYLSLASCGVTASVADPTNCGNCEAVGIGDICNADYNCFGQAYCIADPLCTAATCASWCTLQDTQCFFDSDCAGNYANGANAGGQQNVCVDTSGVGDTYCFSTCNPANTNSCATYPGTTCVSNIVDIDGNTVSICQ